MDRSEKNMYLKILAEDISERFGTPIDTTRRFVRQSRINTLLDQRPEFVDHISIETWSKEVHNEMMQSTQ